MEMGGIEPPCGKFWRLKLFTGVFEKFRKYALDRRHNSYQAVRIVKLGDITPVICLTSFGRRMAYALLGVNRSKISAAHSEERSNVISHI